MEIRHEFADPATSPFVRWGKAGYAVFPPNTIYEVGAQISDALGRDLGALDLLCSTRIVWASIGGARAIHPAATWDAVILGLLRSIRDQQDTAAAYPLAVHLLSLMLPRPARNAWTGVSDFIASKMDMLSGWDIQQSYFADLGNLELEAVRKNHIVNALGQPAGSVRHFLRLFSLFALADDFTERGRTYPRALRFELYIDDPHIFAGGWVFRFFERIRSVRWRPDSNHADDQWLAQCLAARLVDDLDRDLWAERVSEVKTRPLMIESRYPAQADYILDTRLILGGQPEYYFQFEGRTIRWINPTPENRTALTIGCDDRDNPETEHDLVGRLLSLLSWQNHSPIRVRDATTGARRPLPWISMTRAGYANTVVSEPEKQFPPRLSPETWELLALYREAEASNSIYYRFLGYWKIVEAAIKDKAQREVWVIESCII